MRFGLTEDQQMVTDAVRAVADGPLREAAAAIDRQGQLPPAIRKQLEGLGVFGLAASESMGGLDLDPVVVVACLQALAAADAGVAQLLVEHGAALSLLVQAKQPVNLLKPLTRGAQVAALALYDGADHLDAPVVTASAENYNGQWQISGIKPWVLNGAAADLVVLLAQTEAGVGLFSVDLNGSGVVRAPVGEQLGLRGAPAARLELHDAPGHALLDPNATQAALVQLDAQLTVQTAAVAVGAGRGALKTAAIYAQQREQFGKPIGHLQPVQWHVADAVTALDAAALLTQRAAWLQSVGKDARQAGRMAKTRACDAALLVADKAIQIHGGYGYTREYTVERNYRDAQVLALLHGTAVALKTQFASQFASQFAA